MHTTISNGKLTAAIHSKGAELASLREASGREYIWEGDPAFWGKHAPVLFPIVGTLKDGQYRHGGKTYVLPRHGFARDMEFELASREDGKAVFSLKSTGETLSKFPFPFTFRIRYELDGETLSVTYDVRNDGPDTLLFNVGGHPAFALPGDFTEYSLRFAQPETPRYHLLENDLLSERTKRLELVSGRLALAHSLFEDDALVFKALESKSIEIEHRGQSFLRVDFADFPHLGLWTKPGAPFLCIEPWQGYSDTVAASGELAEKEGILPLASGGMFEASYRITILTSS